MFNFSKISTDSFWGSLLRIVLKLIPGGLILPILQGPNRGLRWVKGSGLNGCWLGSYEYEKSKIIAEKTDLGMVCYDIGAHVGYNSLLFSRASGSDGTVFSFEPNPVNASYLIENLKINDIDNVFIFPIALSNRTGFSPLLLDSYTSKLVKKGRCIVPVSSVDDLVKSKVIKLPQIVKIDVEGFELEVLQGMKETILESYPILFIAIDDMSKKGKVLDFIKKNGYTVQTISDRELYATKEA